MLFGSLNGHVEKLMLQYVCCLTGVRTKIATMHHMLVAITIPTRDVLSNTTKLASWYSRAGILKEKVRNVLAISALRCRRILTLGFWADAFSHKEQR